LEGAGFSGGVGEEIFTYNYGFNNLIRFVDPDGMMPFDDYIFDNNFHFTGKIIKTDKPHKLVIDYVDGIQQKFSFNDPETDTQAIRNTYQSKGRVGINQVAFLSEEKIERLMNESGVKSAEAKDSRYSYAWHQGALKMDYGVRGIRSGELDSKSFYVRDGVAYNVGDIGNYLFGRGAAELGLGVGEAKSGAHVNNILLGNKQINPIYSFGPRTYGAPGFWDSPADQRAIDKGWHSSPEAKRSMDLAEKKKMPTFLPYRY
jgi:hypothetical protein